MITKTVHEMYKKYGDIFYASIDGVEFVLEFNDIEKFKSIFEYFDKEVEIIRWKGSSVKIYWRNKLSAKSYKIRKIILKDPIYIEPDEIDLLLGLSPAYHIYNTKTGEILFMDNETITQEMIDEVSKTNNDILRYSPVIL